MKDRPFLLLYKCWVEFVSQNPYSEEVLEHFEAESSQSLEAKICQLEKSAESWSTTSLPRRLELFEKVKLQLQARKMELAHTVTEEMGKRLSESVAEVEKSITCLTYCQKNAERVLAPRVLTTEFRRSEVWHQPLGILLGIMPWNFPVWQTLRFALPSLVAGNVVLLKPAPSVCRTIRKLADIFQCLDGAFEMAILTTDQIHSLIGDPRIRGLSLTGSVTAGKAVAETAGRYLKPSVLELGGNDPALIADDADLKLALEACSQSRFSNAGQSCIAAKRWIVTRRNADEFRERILEKIKDLKMGDPRDSTTSLAPLARRDLRENVHEQVLRAQSHGYTLIHGGSMPTSQKGFFYPATLLVKDDPALSFSEEIFGPVILLEIVRSEEEMLSLAQKSSFGLGASIFTNDSSKADAWASALEVGSVFVNGFVRSDAQLPFGGVKESGWGRELGDWGITALTNIQTRVSVL